MKKNNSLIYFIPLALLAVFVALFYPTFEGLYVRWIKWDESLSHGLLVNSVFIYLMYKNLPWKTDADSKIISLLLLTGLAVGSIAWFFFRTANISALEQSLLIILLCGLYAASYGIKIAFSHRLLLLLPIFTIPIWDQLNTPLVNLSGFIVGRTVEFVGLPAVIEGNSIFIPFGQIVIADGCSGLRYFEIALALAYIIGLLNNYNERKLLPTLIFAALLGLLANWIRIFILVLIGYETKMESSLMANHEYFGWFIFGLMCLPAIYWAPVAIAPQKTPESENQKPPKFIIPLCLLALGPALNLFISSTPNQIELKKILPQNAELISERKMPISITAPNHSVKEVGFIALKDSQFYIQIDQYQRREATDKLVPYIPKLYNSEEWMIIDTSTVNLSQHKAKLTIFKRKASDYKVVQLQWFNVGSRTATSITTAKLLQIPALLSGENNFRIVTLQSPCEKESCSTAGFVLTHNAMDFFANLPSQ